MSKSDIGVIGMAVMGQNLARNIANHGFKTLVYNRTSQVTKDIIELHGSPTLNGAFCMKEFVENLNLPRKIIIMVKAGNPVDQVIDELIPLLNKGDLIIDAGNTYYKDTQSRKARLSNVGINYMGCGVSGGEQGALNGPSIMPGGEKDDWEMVRPIFQAIAAKDFQNRPCVNYMGQDGAGHYVKMVHNGIEYGIMQMIAEVYEILKDLYDLGSGDIGKIFEEFNKGKLNSYLIEITGTVLQRKDEYNNNYLVENILDTAGNKGTGKWTSIEALERGVPTPTITQAVFSRYASSFKQIRVANSKKIILGKGNNNLPDLNEFLSIVESSLYNGIIMSYAQGFHLISQASYQEKWDVNMGEISRIWQGGCIIRSKLLELLEKSFGEISNIDLNTFHIFQLEKIQKTILENHYNSTEFYRIINKNNIYCPTLQSAVSYLKNMSEEYSNANIIQGQRDYFGAHTYERTDREGIFHTNR
ncbi:MAG: NADP-dependent phosphogluconate dehydrogenase [Candidatus Absconditabacteria bacterium]